MCISIARCFVFFLLEEMWKPCYIPGKSSPAGSPSCLPCNKLLERCCCHIWLAHTHRTNVFLQLHAEQQRCLPVDITLPIKLYSKTFISSTRRHNELWLNIHCSSFKMHIWLQIKPRYAVKFSFVTQKDVICWREPRLQEKTAVRLKFSHALTV